MPRVSQLFGRISVMFIVASVLALIGYCQATGGNGGTAHWWTWWLCLMLLLWIALSVLAIFQWRSKRQAVRSRQAARIKRAHNTTGHAYHTDRHRL